MEAVAMDSGGCDDLFPRSAPSSPAATDSPFVLRIYPSSALRRVDLLHLSGISFAVASSSL